MLMKIAVYGDSYAHMIRTPDGRKSWVDYLEEEFDITNYGETGSNLAFSYQNFLENHNRYQTNIFLATSFGRLWVPELQTVSRGMAGFSTVKYNLERIEDDYDRNILQAAHDYYLFLENVPQQKLMHIAMIKDIMRYPNTIIIPCFAGDSLVPGWDGPCLSDISDLDKQYYGIDYYTLDKRNCHLNDTNNKIFAGKIKEYILSNRIEQFKINLGDYHIAVGEPMSYNFGEKTEIYHTKVKR